MPNNYTSSQYSARIGNGDARANDASARSYYTNNPNSFGSKRAVYDGRLQKYVDSTTGVDWSGPVTGNGGVTIGWAVNGKFQPTAPAGAADPNTPPALQVQSTVKTPEIANPALAAITQQSKQAAKTQEELTSFKDTASDILNRTYNRTQAAVDTSGTATALNKSLNTQEAAQRGLTTQAEQRNQAYTSQTQALLDKMDKAFSDEEAKTRAVGERAMNVALTQGQLIPLASGGADTVTARSGAGTSRALNAVTNALLPVEQQIAANRRYNISNFERPLQQELYRNDTALLDAKSTLERQFGGDRRSVIQYLQGLAQQASQLDQQSAEFFLSQKLRLLGLPEQFMASNISNLTALQRLLASARDDVVAQPFDPSLIPGATSYPINVPGRSYQPQQGGWPETAQPAAINPRVGYAPSVPTTRSYVNPSTAAYQRQTGVYPWEDRNLSDYALHNLVNTTGVPAYQGRGVYDIPNDFTWGRTPSGQAAFEDIQRGYE